MVRSNYSDCQMSLFLARPVLFTKVSDFRHHFSSCSWSF